MRVAPFTRVLCFLLLKTPTNIVTGQSGLITKSWGRNVNYKRHFPFPIYLKREGGDGAVLGGIQLSYAQCSKATHNIWRPLLTKRDNSVHFLT